MKVHVLNSHHVGKIFEFEDEIKQLLEDIPYETAGLCLGYRTSLLLQNGFCRVAKGL